MLPWVRLYFTTIINPNNNKILINLLTDCTTVLPCWITWPSYHDKVKQLTRDHRDEVFVSEVECLSQTVCSPPPHLKLFVAFLKTLALDERDLSTSGNFMSFELAIFENTNAFFL